MTIGYERNSWSRAIVFENTTCRHLSVYIDIEYGLMRSSHRYFPL